MRAKLRDNQGITLVVVLMTMAILLSVIGAGLLFSGINAKITGSYQTGTQAFFTADAGLSEAVSLLSADLAAVAAIMLTRDLNNDGRLIYRGGSRMAPGPVARFVGTRPIVGNTLGSGTVGYNENNGLVDYQYQLNVTGTNVVAGVVVAGREVEAQALFGPVAQ